MDFTWSQGLDKRSKLKQNTLKKTQTGTLPSIDAASPTSVSGRTLQSSVSEPWINLPAGSKRQTARERIKAFTERNNPMNADAPNDRFEGRRSFARLQRELVEANKAVDDAKFLGARGMEGFKAYLTTRFGCIVAGWRQLDIDKNGRLTYYEFINACRRMGYAGNLKKLWAELDANCNGSISLMEIDPEVGHYVGTFKLALLRKYGDILTAWQKGIDLNKTGRIEQKEIDGCCEHLGLDLDPKKLFSMLAVGPTSLGMTLQDFDPEAYNRWQSGDLKGLASSQPDTEFLDDLDKSDGLPDDVMRTTVEGGAKKFRAESVARDRAEMMTEKEADAKLRLGLHTAVGFKQALVVRCGSLYSAWREALDLDGNGRIAFREFSNALHRLGFHGNIKGLWAELDTQKKGQLVFADLDPETDAQVKDFKTKLVETYGNVLLGWLKGLDTKNSGMVNEKQFIKECSKLGVSGDLEHLFRVLQPDIHRNFLTVKDFDTRAYLALSRGDFRMISEPDRALGRHWMLCDVAGAHFAHMADALEANRLLHGLPDALLAESQMLKDYANWARHAPPPAAQPRPPRTPQGALNAPVLEEFRVSLYGAPDEYGQDKLNQYGLDHDAAACPCDAAENPLPDPATGTQGAEMHGFGAKDVRTGTTSQVSHSADSGADAACLHEDGTPVVGGDDARPCGLVSGMTTVEHPPKCTTGLGAVAIDLSGDAGGPSGTAMCSILDRGHPYTAACTNTDPISTLSKAVSSMETAFAAGVRDVDSLVVAGLEDVEDQIEDLRSFDTLHDELRCMAVKLADRDV